MFLLIICQLYLDKAGENMVLEQCLDCKDPKGMSQQLGLKVDFYNLGHSLPCPHYHLPPLQVSSGEFEECMGLWSTSSLGNTPPRDSASLNQSRWNPKSSLCLSLIPSGNVY